MLRNSELPLCMLDEDNQLNQYNFVLYHLLLDSPEYFKHYAKSHRFTILDNSAYEFYVRGKILDLTDYAAVVQFLSPDIYILPDVLMDADATLSGVTQFMEKYSPCLNSTPMAVLQGNSNGDFIRCLYEYVSIGITHIAIPFHNSFFTDVDESDSTVSEMVSTFKRIYDTDTLTQDMKYALGRYKFIVTHYKELTQCTDYIHLLGSHCPAEQICYRSMSVIKSVDTGYPVKCAMEGHVLYKEPHKPTIIIDDFMHINLDENTKNLIRINLDILDNQL